MYGYDYPMKAPHAQKIGVDRFITTEERFEDVVKDVDAVLDLVGGELMERSYNVLSPGGRYVNALVMETPRKNRSAVASAAWGLPHGQTPAFWRTWRSGLIPWESAGVRERQIPAGRSQRSDEISPGVQVTRKGRSDGIMIKPI